jgi:hypothetical protein
MWFYLVRRLAFNDVTGLAPGEVAPGYPNSSPFTKKWDRTFDNAQGWWPNYGYPNPYQMDNNAAWGIKYDQWKWERVMFAYGSHTYKVIISRAQQDKYARDENG